MQIFIFIFPLFFINSVESSSEGHGGSAGGHGGSESAPALEGAPADANGSVGFLGHLDQCLNSSSPHGGGCVKGLFVPAWTPHAVSATDVAARAIIYFLSLAYCTNSKIITGNQIFVEISEGSFKGRHKGF